MSIPYFTIVMAVQNGMPYLPAALESMLSQTWNDFELIVVDDHSSDGTLVYLNGIPDKRLILLSSPEKGQTPALNLGIRRAAADWIVRMDGDDWSDPRRLALQRAAILTSPERPVLVSSDYVICDENLQPVAAMRLAPPNPRLRRYVEKKNNPFCHPTVVFHRETALAVGLYDESTRNAQDYHLWLRLLAKGVWSHVPSLLVKYRVRRGSLSVLGQPEQTLERKAILAGGARGSIDPSRTSGPGPTSHVEATYHYKLGFAAWVAGEYVAMISHLWASIRSGPDYRWKAAALLGLGIILPRKGRLALTGYRHVYL